MKKSVFVFLLTLFSQAQAQDLARSFRVRTTLIGFSPRQEQKVHAASRILRKIIRSDEFRDEVLNHHFEGKRAFADNQGLSNEEIYRRILEGSENQTTHGPNNTMDLELELYTDHDSITIGYTYPSIVRIFMNRKYFNRFRPYQVADNMMHEWLHKIGFDHAVKNTSERAHSVPYAIGYIVKGIARRLHRNLDPDALELIAADTPFAN